MMNNHSANSLNPHRPNPSPTANRADCLDSHAILRGQKAVEISHNGATYKLQTTKLGKLILTK